MDHRSPNEPERTAATDATRLLRRVEAGDDTAVEALLPLVYEQLRGTAGQFFRAQRADHTLQPTALVHEAYIKLVRADGRKWQGRTHFCAVAAKAMRQILQDHARAKHAAKRGRHAEQVGVTRIEAPNDGSPIDVFALDEVLSRFAEIDQRGARIVELRFFGGLSNAQIASVLDVSVPTVERVWRRSSAWIRAKLDDAEPGSSR